MVKNIDTPDMISPVIQDWMLMWLSKKITIWDVHERTTAPQRSAEKNCRDHFWLRTRNQETENEDGTRAESCQFSGAPQTLI